jgi:hypothetical protein
MEIFNYGCLVTADFGQTRHNIFECNILCYEYAIKWRFIAINTHNVNSHISSRVNAPMCTAGDCTWDLRTGTLSSQICATHILRLVYSALTQVALGSTFLLSDNSSAEWRHAYIPMGSRGQYNTLAGKESAEKRPFLRHLEEKVTNQCRIQEVTWRLNSEDSIIQWK